MGKREQAAGMFAVGASQAAVARTLGIARVTAMRWHRVWLSHGKQ